MRPKSEIAFHDTKPDETLIGTSVHSVDSGFHMESCAVSRQNRVLATLSCRHQAQTARLKGGLPPIVSERDQWKRMSHTVYSVNRHQTHNSSDAGPACE